MSVPLQYAKLLWNEWFANTTHCSEATEVVVVAIFAGGCGCGCFPSRTTEPEAKMNCFDVLVLLVLCW